MKKGGKEGGEGGKGFEAGESKQASVPAARFRGCKVCCREKKWLWESGAEKLDWIGWGGWGGWRSTAPSEPFPSLLGIFSRKKIRCRRLGIDVPYWA